MMSLLRFSQESRKASLREFPKPGSPLVLFTLGRFERNAVIERFERLEPAAVLDRVERLERLEQFFVLGKRY
jgi:hypothetical protein